MADAIRGYDCDPRRSLVGEVAAEMRRLPELSGVRLVALTGWGQPDDHRRTQEAGFDYHLTKPTDPQKLEQLLASVAVAV